MSNKRDERDYSLVYALNDIRRGVNFTHDEMVEATAQALAEQQERTANALERIADALEKRCTCDDAFVINSNSEPICFPKKDGTND